MIILGQTFVALNFSELASHFPVAGSIYQWSKRLSNRTLGWFTGWFYFWAGVITVTAVAGTVPLVLSSIFGIDLKAASPIPFFNNLVFYALVTLIITTVINGVGVRLLSIINNIGVGAEILGMLVFALILLLFFRVQDVSVLTTTAGIETPETGGYLPVFAIAMFMSLFVVYGFDTAGTFGEETIDASRQAPRGILSAIWLSGIVGAVFLLAIILATPDMTAALDGSVPDLDGRSSPRSATRSAPSTCSSSSSRSSSAPWRSRARPSRLMFSMGRDRRMPLGSLWGTVNSTFKTPTNAAVAVGVLAAIPFLITDSPGLLATGATGLIYLSLLHVQPRRAVRPAPWLAARRGMVQARRLGLDRQHPGPRLGRRDDHQLRALERPGPVRQLRERPARPDEPVADRHHLGRRADLLAARHPVLRRRRCSLILIVGVVYYAVAARRPRGSRRGRPRHRRGRHRLTTKSREEAMRRGERSSRRISSGVG